MAKTSDLVNAVKERLQCSNTVARQNVVAVIESIENLLLEDGEISLVGHFSLKVVETKEKQGFNPATKEPMTIEAHKRIKFVASEPLKKQVASK